VLFRSGVDIGAGASTDDPFVGSPAAFLGMLVDLEPYGSYTSQLFFDSMSFGIPGGCRIFAPRTSRVTDRYINLGRNPVYYIAGFASVVWQTSFAKADGLIVDPYDSTALQNLATALEDDDVLGLTVRWTVYRTIYYDTPELATDIAMRRTVALDLMAKLNGGGFQPNPARSKLVGAIGLWRNGEPAHEPGDRALLATQWPPGRPAVPPCVATGFARLTGSSITLDLGNSMPETGMDLTKQDWGDLQLQAVDPNDPTKVVATLGRAITYDDYCREAYEAGSGILTLDVDATDAGNAADANIQLVQLSTNTPLLNEAPLRALPLVPNLYIDAGEEATGQFQVYERGVPAGGGISVTVCQMDYSGSTIESSTLLTTEADGTVSLPVSSATGTINAYVPLPGPNPEPPTQGLNSQTNSYMYVRVLPTDDNIAALPATFDNVYAYVLSNWNAMAPCMDNWLDLADEASILAYGPLIKKLTAVDAFEDYRYMPVVRDLTAGERTLLYNFLDGVQVAAAPMLAEAAAPPVGAEPPAEPAEPATGLAGMSQEMR